MGRYRKKAIQRRSWYTRSLAYRQLQMAPKEKYPLHGKQIGTVRKRRKQEMISSLNKEIDQNCAFQNIFL